MSVLRYVIMLYLVIASYILIKIISDFILVHSHESTFIYLFMQIYEI